MTSQAAAGTLDQATADRLGAGFHRCLSHVEAADELFAPETFFDLLPPMWRFQVQRSGDDFTTAVTTYRNRGWDADLRTRHAADAPMIRP